MPLVWSISHPTRSVLVVVRGPLELPHSTGLLQTIDRAKASAYRKIIDTALRSGDDVLGSGQCPS